MGDGMKATASAASSARIEISLFISNGALYKYSQSAGKNQKAPGNAREPFPNILWRIPAEGRQGQ